MPRSDARHSDQGWPVVLGCYQAHLGEAGDASVAGGFLAVTVRPWQVMMVAG